MKLEDTFIDFVDLKRDSAKYASIMALTAFSVRK
jgi:hypothetical protein